MINSYDDPKLTKIADDEEGFVSQQSEVNGKTNKYKNNNQKKINSLNNMNNLILSCVKNEEYCLTMLDYLKKMLHFSQIDYYSAYTQILYCFKPKEMYYIY
jgi:hypothetical protein